MSFLPASFRPSGRGRVQSEEEGLAEPTVQRGSMTLSQASEVVMNDKLSTFQHLIGIHSTRDFAASPSAGPKGADLSHNNLHFDGRAAPNLGIYNRVCHREQNAKRGYKFSAVMINSCLGIQIIVAASLTALGAANSSHKAVTAFGAINTVIAGLLTYLKGSGLPNRIRYYEHEWKRVREYIEQRERDFSRPNCPLDVYEVVRVVEAMYEEIKEDIRANTPDSYVSVGGMRTHSSDTTNSRFPRLHDVTGLLGPHEKKFRELEMKYGDKVTDIVENLVKKENARLKELGREVEKSKDRVEATVTEKGQDFEKELESRGSEIQRMGRDVVKEADERRDNLSRIGRELKDEIRFQRREE